jgi:hypothetical protein
MRLVLSVAFFLHLIRLWKCLVDCCVAVRCLAELVCCVRFKSVGILEESWWRFSRRVLQV